MPYDGAIWYTWAGPKEPGKAQNKTKENPQNRASSNDPNMWECFVLFNAAEH